ncbi:MAG: transposase [Candidatus Aminicenantes bacterium]|nr:MAG: transposase [Candidatus Aminicenantes bacterium]
MARPKRLKVKGEAYYHIMSRTVGQEFYLGDVEKEKLFNIIQYYSGFYFVKVLGLSLLNNHFHLLIKSEPQSHYNDDEIMQRIKRYILDREKNKKKKRKKRIEEEEEQDQVQMQDEDEEEEISLNRLARIKNQMEDISEYVRAIKQTFSRWYNKMNNRTGYLWGDRFKSVLLEEGESLVNCLAYIDLNPVRAGIVERPEDYRWCSMGYRIHTNNKGNFFSFDGVFSESDLRQLSKKELIQEYRYFVYKCGNIKRLSLADIEEGKEFDEVRSAIDDDTYRSELIRDFKVPESKIMIGRIRYFSDGLVIGSRKFLKEIYAKFGGDIIRKKDRNVYQTGINKNILSLRKLKLIG